MDLFSSSPGGDAGMHAGTHAGMRARMPMPATGRKPTTALSRVTALGGAQAAPARAVARTSLGLGVLAMSTTGCLITSVPQLTNDSEATPCPTAVDGGAQ